MQPAAWVPNDPVHLVRLSDDVTVVGNPQLKSCWSDGLAGAYVPELMWRLAGAHRGTPCDGVRDDNRSALLTEHRPRIREREYMVAVKGCGAGYDAFQHLTLSKETLLGICHDTDMSSALNGQNDGSGPGFITSERWFGNTPYGGQAPDNAMLALLASLRSNRNEISGFFICPIVALVKLPDEYARMASKFFWYRKYSGDYWQEVRLMPSNVRLYFQSPVTFGADTSRAFSLFRLSTFEACERFMERLAQSTMAALTLYGRTVRHDPRTGGYLGLAYHDVWLDKDAVIAPDGTLHFADLEGIEDMPAANPEQVRELIRMQFYRNVYEANFALEAMAAETERFFALKSTKADRKRWVLDVLQKACRYDPYVKLEREGERTMIQVEPDEDGDLATEIELSSGGD